VPDERRDRQLTEMHDPGLDSGFGEMQMIRISLGKLRGI
jgi:hypothetical protein